MKEVLTYMGLVIALKSLQTLNVTLKCLLLVMGGVQFFTEKPFYQQLAIDGRSLRRPTVSTRQMQKKMRRCIYELDKKGLVEKRKRGNRFWYVLTDKGRLKLLRESLRCAPHLNGNERIFVSYDIPEDYKLVRDFFRYFIKESGFKQFHKSLFVCDRDVEECLLYFVREHKLEPWVKIVRGLTK